MNTVDFIEIVKERVLSDIFDFNDSEFIQSCEDNYKEFTDEDCKELFDMISGKDNQHSKRKEEVASPVKNKNNIESNKSSHISSEDKNHLNDNDNANFTIEISNKNIDAKRSQNNKNKEDKKNYLNSATKTINPKSNANKDNSSLTNSNKISDNFSSPSKPKIADKNSIKENNLNEPMSNKNSGKKDKLIKPPEVIKKNKNKNLLKGLEEVNNNSNSKQKSEPSSRKASIDNREPSEEEQFLREISKNITQEKNINKSINYFFEKVYSKSCHLDEKNSSIRKHVCLKLFSIAKTAVSLYLYNLIIVAK